MKLCPCDSNIYSVHFISHTLSTALYFDLGKLICFIAYLFQNQSFIVAGQCLGQYADLLLSQPQLQECIQVHIEGIYELCKSQECQLTRP